MTPDELLNKIYSENNPWVGQVEDKVLEALVSDAKLTKIQAKPIEHKQPVASGLPVDPKDCELLVAFEANGSCYLTPDASCPFPTQNNGTVLLAECMEARAYEYEQQSDLDYLLIEAQETEPVIGVHKDKPVENVEFMDQMLVQQQEKDADLDYLLVRPVERQMPTRQECENLTADAYAKIGREKEDTMVSSLTMSQPEQRLQNLYEHINPSGAVSGQGARIDDRFVERTRCRSQARQKDSTQAI
ncbi:hypothetical protein EDD86DRAFT_137694 [Gorgonomyces haynaldii]|nr:hypothetical protein EDD86DRAFT_137694 [Gorgonomyces haynaldii]